MQDFIEIKGAREHNLKNVSLTIPKNKLVVFTGLSGSGKSSLAFDTIYAEGQRRYVESLSSYARQFLGIMEKPDVDQITGLSPAISIDQKTVSHNPRSTVGTTTEIYDYLRLLFARIGHPHCPKCGKEIQAQSVEQIVSTILTKFIPAKKSTPKRLLILAPIVKDRKGEFSALLDDLLRRGYNRIRIDNQIYELDRDDITLIKTNRHSIDAVVDRVTIDTTTQPSRLSSSIEKALKLSDGTVIISEVLDSSFDFPEKPKQLTDHLFSEHFACPDCNLSLPEIEPRSFSFNSPHGACTSCDGIGTKLEVDPERTINENLSINEGGIFPWARHVLFDSYARRFLQKIAHTYKFNFDMPLSKVSAKAKEDILTLGVIPYLEKRYKETESDEVRHSIEKFMIEKVCEVCNGSRLKKEVLSITIDQLNISQVTSFSITNLSTWLDSLITQKLKSQREKEIAKPILKELISRTKFLNDVGLNYLSLSRSANTLSGGESQRIRLASQIGSGLSGVLYVLDEPSIGLHPRDHHRLLNTLKNLRDLGNTVIIVEHDPATMLEADWIVDFGPGAGIHGGRVIAEGTPEMIMKNPASITGAYLSGKKHVHATKHLHPIDKSKQLTLIGASEHNLKNVTVSFPLGTFICVTGVSGSGKSTLILETLYKRLALEKLHTKDNPGKHQAIEGLEKIDKVIEINQNPIGRTPRSNPATYTGLFTPIRELYTSIPESKARGYKEGRFSFNVKGGRCENCQGEGQIRIEMQFLPDVYVTCEVCNGARYNRETLEIKYKEHSIADVLDLTVEDAVKFFAPIPAIRNKLDTLNDVGLGYIKLGQPAPTLSGGEAQRVKLATELSKKATGKTVYILDEPTTGLHFADTDNLLKILHTLVDQGNTVIVIEHNFDVIKTADWIIDLGPEGGDQGGEIIATGTVESIIKHPNSYTGQFLNEFLLRENSHK